mgnify:CR=1 FL=1
MKYIFIVNKVAGKGKYKKIVPKIENTCIRKKVEYEIRYITDELDASSIASEYKDEENIIYIVGGDGTLTKALSGIVGTKNKLGIIPSGSGNDTYKAVSMLPQLETKIDLGKINGTYFINVACTGIDAEVGNNVEKIKKTIIPPSKIYTASILYTFLNFKFRKVKIKTDIKTIEDRYTILSICNGSYYGGGYLISPKSELTDGVLEIYFAEKMFKLSMIPLILKLKKGKHVGKRKVHKFRSKHIEIEFEEEIVFNVDGEKLKDKKFVIDVIKNAITIVNDKEFVNEILSEKEEKIEINV